MQQRIADRLARGRFPQGAVLSPLAVKAILPSALRATATPFADASAAARSDCQWSCPTNARPCRGSRCRSGRSTVGAERHGIDRILMLERRPDRVARRGLPASP